MQKKRKKETSKKVHLRDTLPDQHSKLSRPSWGRWLMPTIPVTQEVEIGRQGSRLA
jgi:hypothetical protein